VERYGSSWPELAGCAKASTVTTLLVPLMEAKEPKDAYGADATWLPIAVAAAIDHLPKDSVALYARQLMQVMQDDKYSARERMPTPAEAKILLVLGVEGAETIIQTVKNAPHCCGGCMSVSQFFPPPYIFGYKRLGLANLYRIVQQARKAARENQVCNGTGEPWSAQIAEAVQAVAVAAAVDDLSSEHDVAKIMSWVRANVPEEAWGDVVPQALRKMGQADAVARYLKKSKSKAEQHLSGRLVSK